MSLEQNLGRLSARVQALEGSLSRTRAILAVAVLLHVPWIATGVTLVLLNSGMKISFQGEDAPEPVTVPSTAEILPDPEPEAIPEPTPPVEAEAPAEPEAPAAPAKRASATAEGWELIERGDFEGAQWAFRRVIAEDSNNAEAHYGYGYALGSSSRLETARDELCLAERLSGGDVELSREIQGLLKRFELSCR